MPTSSLASVFRGVKGSEPVSFQDSLSKVTRIPDKDRFVRKMIKSANDAIVYGHLQGCGMSMDEVSAFMTYSAEETDPPLYADMNATCYDRDRSKVQEYVDYMWLLLNSLGRLPAFAGVQVFRGVKRDLSANYAVGREITWHGFTSTTLKLDTLESPQFCGKTGDRTFFIITLTQRQGRDITQYSMVPAEAEVLLPPGTTVKVESKTDMGGGLTIINLTEVESDDLILDLRTLSPPPMSAPVMPVPVIAAAPMPAPGAPSIAAVAAEAAKAPAEAKTAAEAKAQSVLAEYQMNSVAVFGKSLILSSVAATDVRDGSRTYGHTALHFAATAGNMAHCQLLVAAKANMDAKSCSPRGGEAPLHRAADEGRVGVCEYLVFAKADVNTKRCYDQTPLHLAAFRADEAVCQCLVSAKADLAAKTDSGTTAFDMIPKHAKGNMLRSSDLQRLLRPKK